MTDDDRCRWAGSGVARDQNVAAVVRAWANVRSDTKLDLMLAHTELYFAVARLAAYEQATLSVQTFESGARRGRRVNGNRWWSQWATKAVESLRRAQAGSYCGPDTKGDV